MTRVLFVCLGNICRSPSAEGVFRKLVEDAGLSRSIETDSAGTGSWHVGKAPDRRAQTVAQQRGIDITRLRARQIIPQDFTAFDYLIAMDQQNLFDLNQSRPAHGPIQYPAIARFWRGHDRPGSARSLLWVDGGFRAHVRSHRAGGRGFAQPH